MKPEQWQEINLLFHSALKREPSQRAAFLDSACNGDESLRKEVEAFITAYDKAGSFIEAPAFAVAGAMIREDQDQSLVGRSFGPYGIVAAVGAGGMGEVYLAQDTRLGRKVALKLLLSYFTLDEERVRRFQQEARAASSLNHPNIITIYEIGQVEERHFIATEFIEGETLRATISRTHLSLRTTLDIAIQVSSALVAAHKAALVHRDIKPENIMVRHDDGIVKVLDFGLVKLTEKHAQQSADSASPTRLLFKTDAGVVMGTVSYMSPEQARGLNVDARTDIWSLAVLVYEMITGRLPFTGETASDVIASILTTEPPPLTRLAPETPAELERIMSKTLAKDREERYQTARDLLVDLKRLQQRLDVEAEIERTSIQEPEAAIAGLTTRSEQAAVETVDGSADPTGSESNIAQPTSSAEYVVSSIKRHKVAAIVAFVALVVVFAATFAYFSRSSSRSPAITSVAVLPLVNANADPEIEYLSDGISESLINSLSQLPQLKVIARSSSFRYKGKDADPQEVAKALGVEAILTGRVTQRGESLMISIELMDARDRTQIWGEQYNRKLTDLVSLQGEIARDVSDKLHLRLTSTEQQQLTRRSTENTEAYQAYLKGRYYWNRGLAPGYEKSRDYYHQAIALDPSYALAYAGLSDYYVYLTGNGLLPPDETWPKAEEAANKALALDSTLAEAHAGLAGVKLYYYRDWPAAERYFRRAIELNPKVAGPQMHYVMNLVRFGRNEEALALGQRAVELEPLSLRINNNWGRIFFFLRQYDRAIDQFRKTLELDPNYPPSHEWLGYAYEQKGMQREAVEEWAKAMSLSGAGEQAASLERTYATSGFEAVVRALGQQRLEKVNERIKRREYVPASEYVTAYTRLGDEEQALIWLDKAVQERNQFVLEVKVNPIFDKLRDDPRFRDIVLKAGF